MDSAPILSLKYALLPVLGTVCAGVWASFRAPGHGVRSAIQHFAAGLVFAVVAVELLPEFIHESIPGVLLSFAAGTGLMLLAKVYAESKAEQAAGLGFLIAIGADVLIDGILIGIGFVKGSSQGKLLSIALGVEAITLGLVLATTLASKMRRGRAIAAIAGVSALFAVGALLSSTLLAGLSKTGMACMLSFGSAALLYLVTEELLVEAHEVKETPWATAMFFAGFAMVEALEMIH